LADVAYFLKKAEEWTARARNAATAADRLACSRVADSYIRLARVMSFGVDHD